MVCDGQDQEAPGHTWPWGLICLLTDCLICPRLAGHWGLKRVGPCACTEGDLWSQGLGTGAHTPSSLAWFGASGEVPAFLSASALPPRPGPAVITDLHERWQDRRGLIPSLLQIQAYFPQPWAHSAQLLFDIPRHRTSTDMTTCSIPGTCQCHCVQGCGGLTDWTHLTETKITLPLPHSTEGPPSRASELRRSPGSAVLTCFG